MKEKHSTKETLRKIGHVADIISIIIFVLCCVAAAGGFLGLIISPFIDWPWWRDIISQSANRAGNTLSWDVSNLTIKNAEIVSVQSLLSSGISGLLVFYCHLLFKNIAREGTPFIDANVHLLISIGIISLVRALAVPLVLTIIFAATGTESIFTSGFSGIGIIVALFVFALSLVFKYGAELQKEADTTL